jgi:protein O-mannosyl-transferase
MLNNNDIHSNKQILIIYIVLTAITLAVYLRINQSDFIGVDDSVYVIENIHVQSVITLNGIRWAFSTTYAEFWHPLTWLSLMFDYQLHGLNAGGYHLTNLILHVLSTLLLFWLFCRMTGAVWRSAFVAAFFALHPLHVESVAWVSERKDVLSAFFWMLTLCLYVYYTEKPVIQRYWLVVFSFVCALMSKPMVVTLPVIMILLDYWPLNRFESKKDNLILWQMKEKLPFFVLSAVFSIITIYAQHNTSLKYFSFGSRLANASVSFVTYLGKTFWPYDLAVFYPISDQLPAWQVLIAAVLIIFVSVAVIVMIKSRPYFFVGWLWYVIAILPVIGIIRVGDFEMADRYHYLPSIGIAIMLAWGIPFMFNHEDILKNILFPLSIAFLIVLSFLTWKQCSYWQNNITLFRHALNVTKNNYLIHDSIASTLAVEGKIEEALYHFNEAIHIKPDYATAYNNRGIVYGGLGQYQLAMQDFNQAIRLKSNYADAFNNKGLTYFKTGQYQLATEYYNQAIISNPYHANAYCNRSVVYFIQGNNELGCHDARKACDLGNCITLQNVKTKGLCQ